MYIIYYYIPMRYARVLELFIRILMFCLRVLPFENRHLPHVDLYYTFPWYL